MTLKKKQDSKEQQVKDKREKRLQKSIDRCRRLFNDLKRRLFGANTSRKVEQLETTRTSVQVCFFQLYNTGVPN